MGLFDKLFRGTPGRIEAFPTMTGGQQQLLSQLLGGLGGPLQSGLGNLQSLLGGGREGFEAFEAPALRQFQEQIVPGIAERFSGFGSGAQGSSAFQQQLAGAGAGLTENLAAQRAGLQSQALSQLQNLLGTGLGARAFQPMQIPGRQSGISQLLGGLGGAFGQAAGAQIPGTLNRLLFGG